MDFSNIDIETLKDLYYRLIQDYNDGIQFVQYEEDRLIVANVIEFLLEYEENEKNKQSKV